MSNRDSSPFTGLIIGGAASMLAWYVLALIVMVLV